MSWKPTDYDPYDFANRRHIGPSPAEIDEMLARVGAGSLDALIDETIPPQIRTRTPLDFPAMAEHEVLARIREIAAKNEVFTSLIGQGFYGTITPPVILRNILENPAWYTAYTPYQPEISQGRLEALLNYQTMVADLTGLEIANASLLDEASAAAEAMTMARRAAKASVRSRIPPWVPGYWKTAPKTAAGSRSRSGSPITSSMPSGRARVFITAMFCGWQFSSMKKAGAFDFATLRAMVIASAAADASSRSEALAISRPVRSATIVW